MPKFFRVLLVSFIFVFPAASSHAADLSSKPVVRVLVAENKKVLKITVRGAYQVRVWPSLQIAKRGEGLIGVPLVAVPNGMKLGNEGWACQGLIIEPAEERDLYLD